MPKIITNFSINPSKYKEKKILSAMFLALYQRTLK
jgi:hypothetical protein